MAAGTIHGFCGRLLREHAPEAGLDPEFTVVDEERASAWLHAAARAAVVAALDAGRPGARLLTAGLGAEARGGLAGLVAELVRARATRGDAGAVPVAPADAAALRAAWERLGAAAGDLVTLARARAARGARTAPRPGRARVGRARGPRARGTPGDDAPARLARARGGDARPAARQGGRAGCARRATRCARSRRRCAGSRPSGSPGRRRRSSRGSSRRRRRATPRASARPARWTSTTCSSARAISSRGTPRSARSCAGGSRALLVDEYQDVNALQQQLFDLLAGPGEPAGPALVAVGDLKQSIYRFRGADVVGVRAARPAPRRRARGASSTSPRTTAPRRPCSTS